MLALSACAFCAIAAALHLASIAAVVRRMRRSEADEAGAETLEGISIVRPVCGLENFTEETLLSGFRLEYPDYEILFCVAQPNDPVIPLVRRLIELHSHVPARLLIGNNALARIPSSTTSSKDGLQPPIPGL
jgi:ceramide glucosyltransferase